MFTCTTCGLQYNNSKSGFYKHTRTKQEKEKKIYTCDKCNTPFSKKLNLIKHIRHEMQITTSKSKLICSFEECYKIFSSFKTYQLH